MVQVLVGILWFAELVHKWWYGRGRVLPPVMPGVARPVDDVGVLPFRAEVVDTQAVVVVPRDEREIGNVHEVVFGTLVPGIVKVIVGRGRVVVVPAAAQQVDGGP